MVTGCEFLFVTVTRTVGGDVLVWLRLSARPSRGFDPEAIFMSAMAVEE